ncbi:MAG: lipoate--protein ligase [Sphaerochaetaceae bacterium]
MKNIRVFTAEHHDPWFNLATEDWLFKSFEEDQHILFLWRNSPCIVIGRFQNPWVECNISAMERDHVALARRQSGGGAVYHDLGNTNFTFMSPRSSYDQSLNFAIIVDALKEFGIEAVQSGRNDILVDQRKVSGSAFKMGAKKAFHHGTLLINADMGKLPTYLTPDKEKLHAKGVRSVASRVANLTEFNPSMNHENLSDAIIRSFFNTHNSTCAIEDLTIERLSQEQSLYETYQLYSDWKWRFGNTPNFEHPLEKRFSWGNIVCEFDVVGGIVQKVELYSDALSVELIELLQNAPLGVLYSGKEITHAIKEASLDFSLDIQHMVDEVIEFFIKEIE